MFSDVGLGDDNVVVFFQCVWLCSGGCFFYGFDFSLDFFLVYILVLLKSYSQILFYVVMVGEEKCNSQMLSQERLFWLLRGYMGQDFSCILIVVFLKVCIFFIYSLCRDGNQI